MDYWEVEDYERIHCEACEKLKKVDMSLKCDQHKDIKAHLHRGRSESLQAQMHDLILKIKLEPKE